MSILDNEERQLIKEQLLGMSILDNEERQLIKEQSLKKSSSFVVRGAHL